MDDAGAEIDPRRVGYEDEAKRWRPIDDHAAIIARSISEKLGRPPAVMADLGCGSGNLGTAVRRHFDGLTHIGLDWAVSALAGAQDQGVSAVRVGLDPAHVPLADNSCDVVLLAEVIEHLVDTDRAVAEAYRIVKPDGLFVVTTPNLSAWFNRIMLGIGRQPVFTEVSTTKIYGRPGSDVVGHLRLFTTRALTEMLADSGFRDQDVVGAPYHDVPRLGRWIDRLATRAPSLAAQLIVTCRPDPAAAPSHNSR